MYTILSKWIRRGGRKYNKITLGCYFKGTQIEALFTLISSFYMAIYILLCGVHGSRAVFGRLYRQVWSSKLQFYSVMFLISLLQASHFSIKITGAHPHTHTHISFKKFVLASNFYVTFFIVYIEQVPTADSQGSPKSQCIKETQFINEGEWSVKQHYILEIAFFSFVLTLLALQLYYCPAHKYITEVLS